MEEYILNMIKNTNNSNITPKQKTKIIGAIRRVFRQTEIMQLALNKARVELPPKTLKNGSLGKKNQVKFKCAHCSDLFSKKNVQVDHIDPVIPVFLEQNDLTISEIAERIWCDISNLQVLCSTKIKDLPKGQKSCHAVKSGLENFLRDKWKDHFSGLSQYTIKSDYAENSKGLVDQWTAEYEQLQIKKKKELEEKEARKLEKLAKKNSKK